MKNYLIAASILFGFTATASVNNLKQSVLSTFAVIAQGHSLDEVEAIGANISGHEVETRALLVDETRGQEEILEFGCHAHGPQMACHPSGHSHLLKEASFNEFFQSIGLSFAAIEQSFTARGIAFDALEEVKFWKAGHAHLVNKSGDEVFGKFVYEVNGADETVFTECHRHSASDPIDCHFTFSGEDEPDLGGGHQH